MDPKYRALKERLQEVTDLNMAAALLEWDQQVCMPPGGIEARGEQNGTLMRLAHERFTDPEVGRLCAALAKSPLARDYDSDEASLVRWTEREFARKSRVPAALVEETARHTALAQEVWAAARKESDFSKFAPALEKMVELKRRHAEALGSFEDPYDAWLGEFEPGMRTSDLRRLFEDMKTGLVPLVKAVTTRKEAVDASPLEGRFELPKQRLFGEEVAAAMGFDFTRGRQDVSTHPFSTNFSPDDVRITTRFSEDDFAGALFSTMHEAGHGMYEQNVAPALKRTPLCAGATMGMHESQSRLWENVVGRSRGFWKRFYPRLRELFPRFASVELEAFYRAINKAAPSFIRTESDELTYGLHVLVRFELEQELLRGKTRIRELPEAWNAKMKAYLGVQPPDDRRGVLQDVHWSAGLFGYFPTYALGNLIALQLWEAALKSRPSIPADMERGDFSKLRTWLADNVHRHGRKFTAPELVKKATGGEISAEPYLRYLRGKYGEIYGLKAVAA